jgi:hypothetical protein
MLTASEQVLETNVKGCIGVGGECHSFFSCYILGSAILIANSIFDLDNRISDRIEQISVYYTNMHIDNHAITLVSANCSCHNDQRVLGDEIPYTAFGLLVVLWIGLEVELEGFCCRNQQQKTIE